MGGAVPGEGASGWNGAGLGGGGGEEEEGTGWQQRGGGEGSIGGGPQGEGKGMEERGTSRAPQSQRGVRVGSQEGRGWVRLGLTALPGYQLRSTPHPLHLQALAPETSASQRQPQKLGTCLLPAPRPGGRGRGRGDLILTPPPAGAEGQGRAPPPGEGVPGELAGRGGGGWEAGGGAARGRAQTPLPRTPSTSEAPGLALSPVGGGSRMLVAAEGVGRSLRSSAGRARRGACGFPASAPRPAPPHAALALPAALRPGLVGEDGGGQGALSPRGGRPEGRRGPGGAR